MFDLKASGSKSRGNKTNRALLLCENSTLREPKGGEESTPWSANVRSNSVPNAPTIGKGGRRIKGLKELMGRRGRGGKKKN